MLFRLPRAEARQLLRLAGLMAGVVLALSAHAQGEPNDAGGAPGDWEAWFQSTVNAQRHLNFPASYTGANSLTPRADRMYTFSATAHLGARVWRGGEVYVNAEAVSGVPFTTNLVGLGAFTNGEITRAAGSALTPYAQRLFLRQTWNQGGGVETLPSEANQLAGVVDRRRVVLTLGNFSTLDVFDDNTYAKDPRTQFMNWGHWTYAAYDYAADARGFGWGAALEWMHDDWALRVGRMTGPKLPNGLAVDGQIGKHFGDQIELEHSHAWRGQPGKVRLLAWHNRAVVADFKDATSYLLAHPGTDPQTIFAVRRGEKDKRGVGLNLEQALSAHAGLFLRTMKTDGHTETWAFTEVDNSWSTGLLVKGGAWHRPEDSAGVAWGQNTLSADRRRYLETGGISFFIGDGALRYAPESNLEVFYSWQPAKGLWLTADYQHIANPGYNAARGPVHVFALRAHTEF